MPDKKSKIEGKKTFKSTKEKLNKPYYIIKYKNQYSFIPSPS